MTGQTDDMDDAGGLPDDEDDLTSALRAEFGKLDDGDDDDGAGGFEIPLDEAAQPKSDVVDEEEGTRRLREARDGEGKKGGEGDASKAGAGDAKPEGSKAPDAAEGSKPDDEPAKPGSQPAVSDDELDRALGTLPEPVRNRLAAERAEYQALTAPFRGREAELEARGAKSIPDAINWFLKVDDYAKRDPGGYAAWVVQQVAGNDQARAEQMLQRAAGVLGFTVSRAQAEEDEDDPFMSEREKQLAAELREMKRGQQQTQALIGPDSPEEQNRRAVMDVMAEVDGKGQPVRPHWAILQPQILALVTAEVQATGKPATRETLVRAYEAAELANPQTREAALARIATPAAQPARDVREEVKRNAAATAKAKAASTKLIDAPGPGAGRRPAEEDADLDLEAFLRKQLLKG